MVPMRDGIRLATDLYRPAPRRRARRGPLPDDPLPDAVRQDRASATARSPTSSSRTATASASRTAATATAPRARASTSTPPRRTRARTATTRSSGSPSSAGRTAASARSARSFAGITQVRTALERPPHLTAIWPDVVPTNSFQHQSREGGAMQLHMFWALFIHAAGRPGHRRRPGEAGGGLGRPDRACASSSGRRRSARARPRCATCRRSRSACSTTTRAAAYDELWSRKEYDYTRLLGRARRHPGRRTRPAGTTASPTPTPSTSRRWRRRTRRRSGWSSGRGATSACAATRPTRSTSTSAPDSVWGVQRYFAEQLAFFDRWLKEDAAARPRTRRRCGSS